MRCWVHEAPCEAHSHGECKVTDSSYILDELCVLSVERMTTFMKVLQSFGPCPIMLIIYLFVIYLTTLSHIDSNLV
jgi:hypothetical protein